MLLRGALGQTFNISYAVAGGIGLFLLVAQVYNAGTLTRRDVGEIAVSFGLGLIVSMPAAVLNRRAVAKLSHELNGRFVISSQIELLRAREGCFAVAYFYVLLILAFAVASFLPGISPFDLEFFAIGCYFGAHLAPFTLAPPLQRASTKPTP